MPGARAAACVIMSLALSACSGGPDAAPGISTGAGSSSPSHTSSTPPESASIDCSTAIGTGEQLPEDYADVLDAVALPTADSARRALQVGHHHDEPLSYFAKTGLLIQPGTPFSIEVNHPADVAALQGWGVTGDEPATEISTSGCAGEAWMAFAGGIVVHEPRCVELSVEAGDAQEVIHVGAGAPCEGQQTPPSLP